MMGDHYKGPHHRGSYQRRAEHARAFAYSQPDYRCPRCGLTHAEGVQRWGDKGGAWDAGHEVAGQVDGILRAEHAHCNRSHGATYRNRRRGTGYAWP